MQIEAALQNNAAWADVTWCHLLDILLEGLQPQDRRGVRCTDYRAAVHLFVCIQHALLHVRD
jgi:hypothetical protein